jgi:hypothetical protein
MVTKSEPTSTKKGKSWPLRGVIAKKPQQIYSVVAERKPDGTRVERTYDETGKLVNEWEAKLTVQQLGSDATGSVFVAIDAARTDLDFANAKIKAAGGKFGGRMWWIRAKAGLEVVEQLQSEGFMIGKSAHLDADGVIHDAVQQKFLGPLNYRHSRLTVAVSVNGFNVQTTDGDLFPCSVGEALLLDESGAEFSADALQLVRNIRSTAGFASAGRGYRRKRAQ